MKNITHVNFNNHNLNRVRFVEVTSYPAVGEQLTAKYFVDEALSKSVDDSAIFNHC